MTWIDPRLELWSMPLNRCMDGRGRNETLDMPHGQRTQCQRRRRGSRSLRCTPKCAAAPSGGASPSRPTSPLPGSRSAHARTGSLSRANRAYRRLYLCSSSRMQSFMQREFPMPHAVLYESRDGAVVLATEADYAGMLAAHAAAAPTPSGVPTLRLTVEPLGPAAPLTRARPPVAALHIAVAPPSAATQPRLPAQSQYETWRSGRRLPWMTTQCRTLSPHSTLHQALARRRRRAGRGGRPRH